jgi:hypothetical protein
MMTVRAIFTESWLFDFAKGLIFVGVLLIAVGTVLNVGKR